MKTNHTASEDNNEAWLHDVGVKQRQARVNKAKHIIGLLRPFMPGRKILKSLSIGSGFCFVDECIQRDLCPESEFISTDLNGTRLFSFDQPTLTKQAISATELDYPAETFDFILAHQVLEHINGYPTVLDKLAELCKKGGLIYINVPNPVSPAIGKIPDGTWPKPLFLAFLDHNLRKFRRDYLFNTEKYHTGFTLGVLRKHLKGHRIIDLRKARLRQELPGSFFGLLITLFPTPLLFLFVESNIWVCVRNDA